MLFHAFEGCDGKIVFLDNHDFRSLGCPGFAGKYTEHDQSS